MLNLAGYTYLFFAETYCSGVPVSHLDAATGAITYGVPLTTRQLIDTAIARNIKLGSGRQVQFRLDMFNMFNQSRVTGRNTTENLTSPTDSTPANLPFDANGNLIATRSQPKNAGFGVANAYQTPRTLQAQIRFSF